MLQNISREYDIKEEREKFNYKELISRLFTVQNIIIYVLTFMISMVGFGNNSSMMLAPFGLALVSAAISSGVPIALVYISSLLGTAIKFGANTTLMYLFASILLLVTVLIKKPVKNEEETEKIKLGGYLFFSILFVQLIHIICTGFYMYDFLLAITLSITVYIFYKIFVNSISVISMYGIKTVFSIEEVIGASLLVAIAVSSLSGINIFSFSIRNILCIFIVLVLGWRNGILVGGVSGITVGVVLGIIGDGNPIIIATYAISGMLAGLLNKFGKIGVILGFILGNILIAYSANGGTNNIIMFQEILISAIGLLALPKKTKINIKDIIPDTKLLPEATGKIEESTDTILKLNSISKTIQDMSKNYQTDSDYEKNVSIFEDEVIKSLEGMEANLLYDDIYNNEGNIIQDIFDNIVENGIMTQNAIISIFTKHNIYLMNSDNKSSNQTEETEIREMLRTLNSAYRVCKSNLIWQRKLNENNKNMSNQLKNVQAAIDDIANNISEEKEYTFEDNEHEIKKELQDEKIDIKDIGIKQESSGRYIVNAYTGICEEEDGSKCPIKQIGKTIGEVLNDKFTIQDQKCGIRLNRNTCQYTYISADKYVIQTGVAKAKKDGSIISGDMMSRVRLGDGKYLLAISDGMGSGADARKNSKIAISMLERLLSSGFDKETSINIINSAILTANNEEMYATLDIEILDLYAGKIQLLKSGACPTYIKKNKTVTMVKSTSLPAGIMNNTQIDTYDKDLDDGDIIVICSDGIIESSTEYENRDLWLKYLLEEIQTDSPERIADIILKEAVDNDIGKAKDDMSVIVAKVTRKNNKEI